MSKFQITELPQDAEIEINQDMIEESYKELEKPGCLACEICPVAIAIKKKYPGILGLKVCSMSIDTRYHKNRQPSKQVRDFILQFDKYRNFHVKFTLDRQVSMKLFTSDKNEKYQANSSNTNNVTVILFVMPIVQDRARGSL